MYKKIFTSNLFPLLRFNFINLEMRISWGIVKPIEILWQH
ncbi:hypothetical protein DFQ12_0723 [Sphingobacterium detergens]|uniref:Uncharacterized protein n=1 Tax=Sphingobacterium detergens TaxID=1145106 RepID=A0A420BGM5_SPHD1|nr:hypothetical protein DFQ12_0723 [Sphingobacterium detergens]